MTCPQQSEHVGSEDAEPSATLGLPGYCDSERTCSGHLGRSSPQASLQVLPTLKLPALSPKQPPDPAPASELGGLKGGRGWST